MRNAIHEFDPAYHTEQQYLQEHYLYPLLKEIIEQENTTMIDELDTGDIDINPYRALLQNKFRKKIIVAVINTVLFSGFTGFLTWIGINMYNTRCGYVLCPNGTTITIPCNGSFPTC